MKKAMLVLGIVAAILPLASEALLPGESIVLDPNTGDYVITYANAVGRLKQSRFVPSTKINPALRSRFESRQGLIQYSYSIRNGSKGKQPLIGLTFDPVTSILSSTALPASQQEFLQTARQLENNPEQLQQYVVSASNVVMAPKGWSCDVMPNGQTVRTNFRLACSFDDLDEQKHNGLQPGNGISGFGYLSLDLPGIGVGQLRGFGDMGPGFVDEGPDGEISDQLEVIQNNDFVTRNAAIPVIVVPNPFDAALLLDRIRAEMQTWPGKQLLEAAYATKLDSYLTSAANSFRLNQPKVARDQIEAVRKLLAKEHHHVDRDDEDDEDTDEHKRATRFTIDRLAARVLDFDLRYVLKRTERDHDGHEKHEQKKR